MFDMLKIDVVGYGELEVDDNTKLLEISKMVFKEHYKKYLGARINNEIYPLFKSPNQNDKVEFIDIRDVDGYRIYTKTISACFILACKELFPENEAIIHHFLGPGLYFELSDKKKITFKDMQLIEEKMKEIIDKDIEIKREEYSREEAIRIFESSNQKDKVLLFKSVQKPKLKLYSIGEYIDFFHGYLAPSTGFVREFKLKYYYPGVLILFPNIKNNFNMSNFQDQKKLAKIFEESKEWLEILGLSNIGSLNEYISKGKVNDIIQISEALHEKRIAHIADSICNDEDITIILISGPSSSGKTTFAKRLGTQLRVNGKRPVSISMDDYFLDRDKTPIGKDGNPDFESLNALNLEQLNKDLICLLEGESIELPKFNFFTGKSEKSGEFIKVDREHPIIIEGIHALNPKVANEIPDKNKFKIYISALTQLNIDNHNRISTTDTRLLRRMVRDIKFRGNDPIRTFNLWKGVREGEEKYIFPFQENADVMFNSALVYELALLKNYVMPLLSKIDSSSIYYSEVKKLIRFLEYFTPIDQINLIPPQSLLREFIGFEIERG
ncbi:nucleoside kinase [Soehngenia longivitae]|uniref:Nucleoside kinase n=2 Tax=Soehngenia longivitae TaxID=2562294 RepID=A0A4Z0D7H1_9FIRM|nr:nucleoside kinase [Soehngenia longivitae]